MEVLMRFLRPASARQLNFGLAILRVAVGAIFLAHGAQKLFAFGLAGVTAGFGQMGIPFAAVAAPAVAAVELLGGLALIAGLLTRLAGVGLAINMTGALLLVHLPNGFFLPTGFEFVLALLGATVTLALTGAGAYSLDGRIAAARAARVQELEPADRRAARAA
jgi:putative oxidoreductase